MAIEGPLRELGIHDVFQLLDLSRKTGSLRVTSDLRDDEGYVLFEGGKVLHASVRSNPTSIERILRQAGKISDSDVAAAQALPERAGEGLGDRLVAAGVITQKEMERHLRQAIERWTRVIERDPAGEFARRARRASRTASDLQSIFARKGAA